MAVSVRPFNDSQRYEADKRDRVMPREIRAGMIWTIRVRQIQGNAGPFGYEITTKVVAVTDDGDYRKIEVFVRRIGSEVDTWAFKLNSEGFIIDLELHGGAEIGYVLGAADDDPAFALAMKQLMEEQVPALV